VRGVANSPKEQYDKEKHTLLFEFYQGSIPSYDKISSKWLEDSGRDRYKEVKWYDESISGYTYIDKDGDFYFKYGGGSNIYYETEKDAINALYVEKKYDKLRKKGRKRK
jgi:hypothetical protein